LLLGFHDEKRLRLKAEKRRAGIRPGCRKAGRIQDGEDRPAAPTGRMMADVAAAQGFAPPGGSAGQPHKRPRPGSVRMHSLPPAADAERESRT